ncbi:MAG: DNA polymerase III subunit beta [Bacteroidales bacterium]|nr:DNA polymerase III subunit beta [Bacteroidales bacterium]
MKFIVNSQLLVRQLQALSGVLTNNNTIPIISCFHFHLEENELTLKTTDLDTTLVSRIEVETGHIDKPAEIAIPSRLLLDILKSLDDVPLTFNINESTYLVEITSGEGVYRLAGLNADTYPTLPEASATASTTLQASALVEAINMTVFAASTDEMRKQMGGIFCEMSPENITFVATDAHKLVRYRRNDMHSDEASSFILPRKPITIVKNILANRKEDCEVKLEYNSTNVYFTFGNFYIVCRLVEGRYPNYEAAIPKENPNHLTVDRASFLNTLRRVGLFANPSTSQVRLTIDANQLVISAEDIEFSNDAREKLPCTYEGEPMEIGFNAKFLIEMVGNLDSEQILIDMSQPSRAGIIFPVTDGDKSADILMLVMPVMLAN